MSTPIPSMTSTSEVGSTSLGQDIFFEGQRIGSPPWLNSKIPFDPVLIGGALLVVGAVYLMTKKKG